MSEATRGNDDTQMDLTDEEEEDKREAVTKAIEATLPHIEGENRDEIIRKMVTQFYEAKKIWSDSSLDHKVLFVTGVFAPMFNSLKMETLKIVAMATLNADNGDPVDDPHRMLRVRTTSTIEEFQRTNEWKEITGALDRINRDSFSLGSAESLVVNGVSIPVKNGKLSLLLYGLIDENRYNGTSERLFKFLQSSNGVQTTFMQAVSGAGKTRAILDVLANHDVINGKQNLVYIDLAGLEVTALQLRGKNFVQEDVEGLRDSLPSETRDDGMKLFRTLLLARTMVLAYLREIKHWNSENLLCIQLSLPSNSVMKLIRRLFDCLKRHSISDWGTCLSNTFVALDEANVALDNRFGMYQSRKTNEMVRPFLTCIYDALGGVPSLFSGTSYSLKTAIDSLVANMADFGAEPNYFTAMTTMQSENDIRAMMRRFEIDVSSVPRSDLVPLFGRCRFVATAISIVLDDAKLDPTARLPVQDSIKEAISRIQDDLASKIRQRLVDKPLERNQIEKIVVAAMIDKPLRYGLADDTTRIWADSSFFWVAGRNRTLEVSEPIVVSAIQNSMSSWDPVQWIVNRVVNEPAISASQQGFDFEQISARKLATSLSNGAIRIKDSAGNIVPVSLTPDGATALVIKAPSVNLDEFLATPQCTHMFIPAIKDGPDVVFWIKSGDAIWYAVFVQSKYYRNKISGRQTVAAANTVLNKGTLGTQYRRLQVFFPFMGATSTFDPNVLVSSCDQNNNVYLYLDHENEGEKVLGVEVCRQLLAAKEKRKEAP